MTRKNLMSWKCSSNHSSKMRCIQKSVKSSGEIKFHMAFSFPGIPAVQSQTIWLLIFKTKLNKNLHHIHMSDILLPLKWSMLSVCNTLPQNLWIDSAYAFTSGIITRLSLPFTEHETVRDPLYKYVLISHRFLLAQETNHYNALKNQSCSILVTRSHHHHHYVSSLGHSSKLSMVSHRLLISSLIYF